jgi:anaerobic selenocysteine-containing dehydrogenase
MTPKNGNRRTTYRSCNLCEAICGLTIDHDDTTVFAIRGDPEDPLSQGYICPKAVALQDLYTDPDRLRTPVLRTESGFVPISWDDAYDHIERELWRVRSTHGNDAVAMYLGNPTVHNYGAMLFAPPLLKALRTKNRFSATSVDQLPHHFASHHMFGHGLCIPVPDIDRTQVMLILGANPVVSNGSLMTAPGVKRRLKAIQQRGGQVVVVDPKRTQTAALADEHITIRPGTDALFLAALLHVVLETKDVSHTLGPLFKNVAALKSSVATLTPTLTATHTGVPAETTRRTAMALVQATSAVVYGRMGVSTQANGGLCHWLINALNIVTGNLDRPGGQMFPDPAVPIVSKRGTLGKSGRWHSAVRQLPEFEGELPVSAMAEDMLTTGPKQIRALITNAGNPVLSTPNGTQLERALDGLDFYVAIDIYVNETTRHANIILPPTAGLETDHYDLVFNAFAVRNVAKYSPATLKPAKDARHDYQIFKELARRMTPRARGIRPRLNASIRRATAAWSTPQRLINLGLMLGPYGASKNPTNGLTLRRLKQAAHGVDLGPLTPRLPGVLRTRDQTVNVAPDVFVQRLAEVVSGLNEPVHAPGTLALIGRRDLRDNNSWMHNTDRLMRGKTRCTLQMNPVDAKRLALRNGDDVTVRSRVGAIVLPLEVSDALMPGVVSIPHGYGHHRRGTDLNVAIQHAGVSINDVQDDQIIDPLTGNAAFSGQRVTVTLAAENSDDR